MEKLRPDGKPFYQRKGEQVGGGYFIIRRGAHGNRIKPVQMPFEHPDEASARAELTRLRDKHPDHKFSLFCELEAGNHD